MLALGLGLRILRADDAGSPTDSGYAALTVEMAALRQLLANFDRTLPTRRDRP